MEQVSHSSYAVSICGDIEDQTDLGLEQHALSRGETR